MIENEKIDTIDALIFGLNRTANWRRKMAAKYPVDPRNADSIRLHTLCTQAEIFSEREQNLGLIDWSQLDSPQGGANAHRPRPYRTRSHV
jgi:hypothetical protein